MIDIDQDGVEQAAGRIRIEPRLGRRQRKKIPLHKPAASVRRQFRSQRHQPLHMPRDDRFEHLDHEQRGDRFVVQHRLGRMAKPSPPTTTSTLAAGKFGEPEPGQGDLGCREKARHQEFVAEL